MSPGGVIAANTFSHSALYDHESVTYRDVFGPYFNLKHANRVILGRNGGVRPGDLPLAWKNATQMQAGFAARGISSLSVAARLDPRIDWNPDTRILTDQYSPSNLLNALPRREQ